MKKICLAVGDFENELECDNDCLYEAIERLGFQVCTPDWKEPNHDWSQYALVTPRLTWDYQNHPEKFDVWMQTIHEQSLLCNPLQTLKWSSHKRYLRDLEAIGLPIMPTIWIRQGEENQVPDKASSFGRRQAFMKPSVGANSDGCLLFNVGGEDDDKASAHASDQLKSQDEVILQPFCTGIHEQGEFSVLLWDGAVSHGVRKIPVPGDYRAQDEHGATDEPWEPPAEVIDIAVRAASVAPGGWHYARVDFLHDYLLGWRIIELEMLEPSLFLRHCPSDQIERLAHMFVQLANAQIQSKTTNTTTT